MALKILGNLSAISDSHDTTATKPVPQQNKSSLVQSSNFWMVSMSSMMEYMYFSWYWFGDNHKLPTKYHCWR